MKSISYISMLLIAIITSCSTIAQTNKETIKVWGNCGMCKKTIEKAAKSAGASKASWDADKQALTMSYAAESTSSMKIQEAIAQAGYDTQDVTADQSAYDKLHGCCKYDRKTNETPGLMKCCSESNCGKTDVQCKENGCCKGKSCCKSK